MARPSLLPRPMLPRCPQCQFRLYPFAFRFHVDSFSRKPGHARLHLINCFCPSRLFNPASAACARLFCRSCNALSRHASDASRPPRRTPRGLRAPPLFGWCPHRSSPRKRLHFVARLPFFARGPCEAFPSRLLPKLCVFYRRGPLPQRNGIKRGLCY